MKKFLHNFAFFMKDFMIPLVCGVFALFLVGISLLVPFTLLMGTVCSFDFQTKKEFINLALCHLVGIPLCLPGWWLLRHGIFR